MRRPTGCTESTSGPYSLTALAQGSTANLSSMTIRCPISTEGSIMQTPPILPSERPEMAGGRPCPDSAPSLPPKSAVPCAVPSASSSVRQRIGMRFGGPVVPLLRSSRATAGSEAAASRVPFGGIVRGIPDSASGNTTASVPASEAASSTASSQYASSPSTAGRFNAAISPARRSGFCAPCSITTVYPCAMRPSIADSTPGLLRTISPMRCSSRHCSAIIVARRSDNA